MKLSNPISVLKASRERLENFLPGIDQELHALGFSKLEEPDGKAIALYRAAGGAGLLIPETFKGKGASPIEAIHIQRALGARSPSLAVAVCMHNFSVATLVEMVRNGTGLEGLLLEAIATQNLLVASGFAEGKPGLGILSPTMTAVVADGGIKISGSKKPCSLSQSMNLLTVSVKVLASQGRPEQVAVALVPAGAEGITRKPFWQNKVLGAAESDELILEDVFVENQLVFPLVLDGKVEPTQLSGYVWFELLISASYIGIASGLAERALLSATGNDADIVKVCSQLETAMAGLEGVAFALGQFERSQSLLARILLIRYGVQELIVNIAAQACELVGGMSFINDPEVANRLAATRALAFHPPSRKAAEASLAAYLRGGTFELQ